MLLLWSRLVVAIVVLLPEKSKFTWQVEVLFDYIGCKKRVVAWHYAQLEKLDFNFSLQRAQEKLIAARKGMDPSDPKYPDIFDFCEMPSIPEAFMDPSVKK